jgi:hypothetical protein
MSEEERHKLSESIDAERKVALAEFLRNHADV